VKRFFDLGEGMDNLPKMIKDGIDIINESMEAFAQKYDELKQAVDEAGELGINFEQNLKPSDQLTIYIRNEIRLFSMAFPIFINFVALFF
jgi:hypothetical protein